MIARILHHDVLESLQNAPVVAILGPRQCGKSTLARQILDQARASGQSALLLDLERPSDLAKLSDPEAFLIANQQSLICLDEIQSRPELFPVIRAHVDSVGTNGQLLITGSATPELLRQGAESLAGRIAFHELTPFHFNEVEGICDVPSQLIRGGYPRSLLATSDKASYDWRRNFVRTYLERDLGQFGMNVPSQLVRRLWRMLAHLHGQLVNHGQVSNSLGVSNPTARKYTDLLIDTFMVRSLEPYHGNLKKRLVKSPKLYIRDPGILCSLLEIRNFTDLLGHPVYGTLWEGFVIETLVGAFPDIDHCFFRSSHGAEIDLVLRTPKGAIAIDCKVSSAPSVTRGFHIACDDVDAQLRIVVAPVEGQWPIGGGIEVHGPRSALNLIDEFIS